MKACRVETNAPREKWKDSCCFEDVYVISPCFPHSLSLYGMQYPVRALLDISGHSLVGMALISHPLVLLVEPFAPEQMQPTRQNMLMDADGTSLRTHRI